MPGIAGSAGMAAAGDRLQPMLDRLTHHSWYVRQDWAEAGGRVALGQVSLGLVNPSPQPTWSSDRTKCAVMDGEILDYSTHRRTLEATGHVFQSDSHAEVLLHGLQSQGYPFLKSLAGHFAAAIWDVSGTLQLITDQFGMRPLHYAQLPGRLLFGSELKALFADPALPRTSDPVGLGQFFTFGHCLGEATTFASVRLVPAASVLTYTASDDQLKLERYARLGESWRLSSADTSELLDRIDTAFAASVERCTQGAARLGISLSGGMDGRTILAAIPSDRPVTAVTLGLEGSIDVRSAAELARLTGRPHHTHILDSAFLGEFERHLRDLVHLTDGQRLDQGIVMPTLPLYRRLGIDVLLRGHAGELMHMTKAYNFSLDSTALSLTDTNLEEWLWSRLRAGSLGGIEGDLFAPGAGSAVAARDSLREALAETSGLAPTIHRIWQLFVSQRLRRETATSLAVFGSVVETRLPYLDARLLEAMMAAPPELKLGETLQSHILQRRRPSFLRVVNANTGARVGAGGLARRLRQLRLKVLAKLRVKGYQPYERLGPWLRRELRPFVESILLSDRCLGRGVLKPETVRSVVENHLANRRNHTNLLLAMLVFELGQRELVDGEVHTNE